METKAYNLEQIKKFKDFRVTLQSYFVRGVYSERQYTQDDAMACKSIEMLERHIREDAEQKIKEEK